MSADSLLVMIGGDRFQARLQRERAPRSCEQLLGMLPYHGKLIHARWSGEALWAPLAGFVPAEFRLAPESPQGEPRPGEILLFAGEESEPELLVPYGTSRFASVAGSLKGNPVLLIEDRLDALASIGREVLWRGATTFSIEVSP